MFQKYKRLKSIEKSPLQEMKFKFVSKFLLALINRSEVSIYFKTMCHMECEVALHFMNTPISRHGDMQPQISTGNWSDGLG